MAQTDVLKENLAGYRQNLQEARESVDYWVDGPITEFVEDIHRLMEERNVSRAELARRLGTSRAYVTKLLGGNANFTLQTMVKISMALGAQVHVHVADRKATTRWTDEVPSGGDDSPSTAAKQQFVKGGAAEHHAAD